MACVPRPPQPTSPAFSFSLPCAAHQFRFDDLKGGGAGDGGRQKRPAGYRTAFHKVNLESEPFYPNYAPTARLATMEFSPQSSNPYARKAVRP